MTVAQEPAATTPAAPEPDPSRTSYYVSDALYTDLMARFSDWQRCDRAITDPAVRDACRQVVEREARLLDQHRYEDWLAMFARECIYWVPGTVWGTPQQGDPRREITVTFDDRRRLEDRIYRLRTGYAWSQAPASRTVRMISNVEVFATQIDGERMVRSNVLISEFWGEETRILTGWVGHRLVARADGRFEIAVKQVNLIDCDRSIRNPSIIL